MEVTLGFMSSESSPISKGNSRSLSFFSKMFLKGYFIQREKKNLS
jgi:hypothetical protein